MTSKLPPPSELVRQAQADPEPVSMVKLAAPVVADPIPVPEPAPAVPAKPMRLIDVFRANLEAVHKLADFDARLKLLVAQGESKANALVKAMAEFGFVSEKRTRKTYTTRTRRGPRTSVYRMSPEKAFREAWEKLPLTASEGAEIMWLKSHEAMSRKARQKDSSKLIRILAADLVGCPSRSAAQSLQHWVNSPEDFFKQIMSEVKKRMNNVDELSVDEIPGIADIRAILDTLEVE